MRRPGSAIHYTVCMPSVRNENSVDRTCTRHGSPWVCWILNKTFESKFVEVLCVCWTDSPDDYSQIEAERLVDEGSVAHNFINLLITSSCSMFEERGRSVNGMPWTSFPWSILCAPHINVPHWRAIPRARTPPINFFFFLHHSFCLVVKLCRAFFLSPSLFLFLDLVHLPQTPNAVDEALCVRYGVDASIKGTFMDTNIIFNTNYNFFFFSPTSSTWSWPSSLLGSFSPHTNWPSLAHKNCCMHANAHTRTHTPFMSRVVVNRHTLPSHHHSIRDFQLWFSH